MRKIRRTATGLINCDEQSKQYPPTYRTRLTHGRTRVASQNDTKHKIEWNRSNYLAIGEAKYDVEDIERDREISTFLDPLNDDREGKCPVTSRDARN